MTNLQEMIESVKGIKIGYLSDPYAVAMDAKVEAEVTAFLFGLYGNKMNDVAEKARELLKDLEAYRKR